MLIFGIFQRLFEEPIAGGGGEMIGDGGLGDSTSTALVPAGESAPAPEGGLTPDPAAPAKWSGQLYTEDGKFNPGLRPILDTMRRDNPIAERHIRGSLHENRQLRAEFPGGLAEVKQTISELQSIIENAGGSDALSEARGELEFFHNLDSQFTAGDPRFIQAMIDAPGGKDAFLKLAPAMMAQYEQLWPEGFNHWLNGKLLDTLRNSDFRVNLERIADFLAMLPNTAEAPTRDNAAAYWVAIRDFYNTLTASVKTKPALPAPSTPAPVVDSGRESDIERRERQIKEREFSDAGTGEINAEFDKQWRIQAKNTTAIKSHIRPAFDMKMKAALEADKSVDRAIQGYFAKNDVEGYRSYMRAQYQKHGARILKAEMGHYRTGSQPAPAAAAPAPVTVGQPAPARTEAGWTIISRRLTPKELGNIDLEKTTRDMMGRGEAIMKNGQKVKFTR